MLKIPRPLKKRVGNVGHNYLVYTSPFYFKSLNRSTSIWHEQITCPCNNCLLVLHFVPTKHDGDRFFFNNNINHRPGVNRNPYQKYARCTKVYFLWLTMINLSLVLPTLSQQLISNVYHGNPSVVCNNACKMSFQYCGERIDYFPSVLVFLNIKFQLGLDKSIAKQRPSNNSSAKCTNIVKEFAAKDIKKKTQL